MLQRSTSYANPELPTYLASLLRNLPDDGVDATLRLLECVLVGGTASFETFLATRANLYGQASRSKCEEVWNGDHIAYRCRTCGLSDSSCMCVQCFDPAQHENHDYRIYRCSYGGCCDCGDDLAWKPSGFCKTHCSTPSVPIPDIASEECARLDVVLDTILELLLSLLRMIYGEVTVPGTSAASTHTLQTTQYCFSDVGRAHDSFTPRTQLLLCRLAQCLSWLQPIVTSCVQYRARMCRALQMPTRWGPSSTTVLDSCLTFGILLPLESADALGVLFLKLLFDKDFKLRFTAAFLAAYPFYIRLYNVHLENEAAHTHVSRFIDRLFCQLFHSAAQLHQMDLSGVTSVAPIHGHIFAVNARRTATEQLVHFLLGHLLALLKQTQRGTTLDCNHDFLKLRTYSRFCSELRTLLVHPPIAGQLEDDSIMATLLDILSTMQCMDLQTKQRDRHVEFESSSWTASFVLDYEVMLVWQYILLGYRRSTSVLPPDDAFGAPFSCAITILLFGSHMNMSRDPPLNPSKSPFELPTLVQGLLEPIEAKLAAWCYESMGQATWPRLDSATCSLHLPLHHFYASALSDMMAALAADPKALLALLRRPGAAFWHTVVYHSVQVQHFVRSIKCHLWVLNGQSMWQQVYHYHSRHWRHHGLHKDLFLLQLGAALDPAFVSDVVSHWLPDDKDAAPLMLDELLKLVLQLVLDPTHVGALSSWQLLIREVKHWLSTGPLTRTEFVSKCNLKLLDAIKEHTKEEDDDILNRALEQVGVSSSAMAATSAGSEPSPQAVLQGLDNHPSSSTSTFTLQPALWADICPYFEAFTLMDAQKCEQNRPTTQVLLPPLDHVLPCLDARDSVQFAVVSALLSNHLLLALVYRVLHAETQRAEDAGVVQTALHLLYTAVSIVPRDFVPETVPATSNDALDAIVRAWSGKPWWDAMTTRVEMLAPTASLLELLQQLPSSPLVTAVLSRCDPSAPPTAPAPPTPKSGKPDHIKERQAKILQKLRAQQNAFLRLSKDRAPADEVLPVFSQSSLESVESPRPTTTVYDCALCHDEAATNSAFGSVGFLTPSRVACLASPPLLTPYPHCHARVCGHVVHRACMQTYLTTLDDRQRITAPGEFVCPVCRRLSNTLVPLSASSASPSSVVQWASGRFVPASVPLPLSVRTFLLQVHATIGNPLAPTLATLVDMADHLLFLAELSERNSGIAITFQCLANLVHVATLQIPSPPWTWHQFLAWCLVAPRAAPDLLAHYVPFALSQSPTLPGLARKLRHVQSWLGKTDAIAETGALDQWLMALQPEASLPTASFSLVALPKHYVEIYLAYCQKNAQCAKCNAAPQHPAICLLCGKLVCCFGACCQDDQGRGECTQHSLTCGVGFGCFLLLRACTVLLLLGQGRCSIWGSVYLDKNGEEDPYLRRGKTLYLSNERYTQLWELVVRHGFTESSSILANTSRQDGLRY
ncbi:hypothetical protein SPRG_12411 [Saprolegnia parasitica CBS 223.65]|uniref:E3 ubiquitin-protein ligase n=1 Tax=Saprolegnia parasitica (strain CBS 223.65) TaxID=695850 RepID=A0A067BSA4_SAPPC|nr:hypothetical protein SPRG_12411 [Saprolegnia parasitica CBS 223.65]KDO21404.1 hypothetical protein SPRG_12411 [Saprolegnia parasitica CBS 223.65]|eukprot:XP_012207851.1 hypothetical protein SPRG_12411 [Saprolegnia parasitica CBS 223.65]